MLSSHRDNIVDRAINRSESQQVSSSTFAFLFSELVQYTVGKTSDVDKIEERLSDAGYHVGVRLLELLAFRERAPKRENKLLGVLHRFSNPSFWELFYVKAPTLQKVLGKAGEEKDAEGQYMIRCSEDLLVNKYISTQRKDDNSDLNPGAFVAGVVKGMLSSAGFPADVTAHYWDEAGSALPTTVILIRFDSSVLEREREREKKKA